MATGPGKYDVETTVLRNSCEAEGVVVIVLNGKHGSGFAVQALPEVTLALPGMLENLAKDIRADLEAVA